MPHTPNHDKRRTERRQGDRRAIAIAVHPDRRNSERREHDRRIVTAI